MARPARGRPLSRKSLGPIRSFTRPIGGWWRLEASSRVRNRVSYRVSVGGATAEAEEFAASLAPDLADPEFSDSPSRRCSPVAPFPTFCWARGPFPEKFTVPRWVCFDILHLTL